MRLSLSEVETTIRKAAVGVGLALGLGEDAGRAAAWAALAEMKSPELMDILLEVLTEGSMEEVRRDARVLDAYLGGGDPA